MMLARAARVSSPRGRRRAARTLFVVVLAARRRAPAAALVVLLCASAAALAAAARAAVAARRWAGSGAASTSCSTRRYCCSAQYRTKHSRTHRCRRSGRCPARRPAATASRWSRPPTRAACTSGRRRGEPLLCCGLPLFWAALSAVAVAATACYGCLWIAGGMGAAPSDGWHI